MQRNGVRYLLMGGQACVFYGAAEFSRDLDLLILLSPENLTQLQAALQELEAVPIAVPPFDERYLAQGHAVHFRCLREDVHRLRIDVMSVLRGVPAFEEVWRRRTTIAMDGIEVNLLGIEDLVRAKTTQRDKDWPMIRRLVEQHYAEHRERATAADVDFWLRELRSPSLLGDLMSAFPDRAELARKARPALAKSLEESLRLEEEQERTADREYWKPLRDEMERLRHADLGKNVRNE